jgi:outer membrane immunogenic protein
METGMQYRFLASAAVAAIMTSTAFAADMMPLKAAAPVALYDWSGIYLGGVVGGAWGTNDISDPGLGSTLGAVLGLPTVQSTTTSGFIGGIEGGSRYQFAKLVVGWEADITWGDLNGTNTTSFGAPFLPASRTFTSDSNWIATATSTIGVAHNNWLIYGKAGVAWENVNYTDNWTLGGAPLFSGTGSDNRVGWTVGTGVEWAVWQNWSIKAEYDYLDFGTRNVAINGSVPLLGGVGISSTISDSNHINQFKAGLNYHIMSNFW